MLDRNRRRASVTDWLIQSLDPYSWLMRLVALMQLPLAYRACLFAALKTACPKPSIAIKPCEAQASLLVADQKPPSQV